MVLNTTIVNTSFMTSSTLLGATLVSNEKMMLLSLALLSMLIGVLTAIDLLVTTKETCKWKWFFNTFKMGVIGFFALPFMFFSLVAVGDSVLAKFGLESINTDSIYMAYLTSTILFGRLLVSWIFNKIESKG